MPKAISELLVKHRSGLCRECLIVFSRTERREADAVVANISHTVRIVTEYGCCPGCLKATTILRFAVGVAHVG